jgi:hypothetical protein
MNTSDGTTKYRPLGSQDPLQTQLANAHEWLKPLREIVIDVSAITAFASAIIGFILIRIYLSNFSISISPLDAFGASSLQIFVFFFIAGLGSAVFVFLLPLCATYIVPPETRDSLPDLFGRRYIPPDPRQPRPALLLTRGHGTFPDFIKFLKEYAIFYLPTLGLISSMPFIIYFQIPIEKIVPWVVLASFIISGLLLYIYKLKGRAKLETFYQLLWLNWATVMWMLLLEIGMMRSWAYALNESSIMPIWQATIEAFAVSLLVVLCHMSMAWAKFSIRALAGFAVILLGIFAVYPGYAAIGAAALQEAWLGGGTRISYTVVGPPATIPEPTGGCLILATTSHVLIGELDDNSCPSLRRFWLKAPEVKPRPVRVFSRGEIKISEPPGG